MAMEEHEGTVCVVVLHTVFRQPLDWLLQYKEFQDD
jgi:hypothetical protein